MAVVDDSSLEGPASESLRSAATAQLVLDIATAAAGERELDHILAETLDRLATVVALTGGSIALVEGDDLVIRAAVGPFASEAVGQRLRRGDGRSWSVVTTLEPVLIGDIRAAGAKASGPGAAAALRSWLAVPLVRRGQGIGLLEVDSTQPDAFRPEDVELIMTIARALAGPVELASRFVAERQANALRDAFIGVISHELRTPITTIYGLSKMLRQRHGDLAPEVEVQAIEDVEAEADRLYRLVEDLLVLSRAERGRVESASEPLVIGHVLRRAVDAEAARWPTRRFALEMERGLPLVLGEETYVEQIVRNLLTNAAKYSDVGDPIEVHVASVEGDVVVTVLDEGIGISADDEERVFELFYRSPLVSRKASGAGIGLFVTRQLVEAMGGRVWARPRPERGTEVGFALPVLAVEDGR
ncbi:MAG TPA: ATP-binding protein [Candidatus Limnocylindrales bacterium]|nr:ATP-binding protein [Candidatus Limnocylindrales bacterium]